MCWISQEWCWDMFLPWDDWPLLLTCFLQVKLQVHLCSVILPFSHPSGCWKTTLWRLSCHDFPGGLVVKNLPCNTGGASSILGWGTKISYARGATKPTYHELLSLQVTIRVCESQRKISHDKKISHAAIKIYLKKKRLTCHFSSLHPSQGWSWNN